MTDNIETLSNIKTDPVGEFACTKCQGIITAEGQTTFDLVECPHCEAGQIVPGRLGNFLLLHLLGEGATATVFNGLDENLQRPVAIKVLLPHLANDEQFLATLRHEAKLAASLNHPHVAHVYELNTRGDQPFLVMELLPGGSLKDMMDKRGALPQDKVLKIGMDIAKGLEAASRGGLIHGDVKPENILFDDRRTAKIVDFGLASPVGGGNQLKGVWGTPHYIAPERCRKEPIDFSADLYSLGATLYHALAGKEPFQGDSVVAVLEPRLTKTPQPLRSFNRNIAPEVDGLLKRMLQPLRSKRHPSFKAALAHMNRVYKILPKGKQYRTKRQAIGGPTTLTVPTSRKARTQRRRRVPAYARPPAPEATAKRWILTIIIVATLLFLFVLLISQAS